MKRLAALLAVLLCLVASSALAQRIECPVGGFSVTLPDHFVEGSLDPDRNPELCFYWYGKKLTVLGYASWMGEVADSDLFQVLAGNEEDPVMLYINDMQMSYSYSEDPDASRITITYSWMDRGNKVTLYFDFEDPSVEETVNSIIYSISFDAGH